MREPEPHMGGCWGAEGGPQGAAEAPFAELHTSRGEQAEQLRAAGTPSPPAGVPRGPGCALLSVPMRRQCVLADAPALGELEQVGSCLPWYWVEVKDVGSGRRV